MFKFLCFPFVNHTKETHLVANVELSLCQNMSLNTFHVEMGYDLMERWELNVLSYRIIWEVQRMWNEIAKSIRKKKRFWS